MATATRQVTLPAGAAVIDLRAEVAGETATDASVRVVVVGDGHSETVFEVADGARQSRAVTADLSAFAGETVTLRLATEGDARLAVESLQLAIDTDGDGLTDPIEREGIRTGAGEIIQTAVAQADTDGDGFEDGTEVTRVSAADSPVIGGYFVLHSNPKRADSDRDGVDDFEERRTLGSLPFVPDTDGDGYTDLVDADVDADSAPPVLRFRSTADDFKQQLTVVVTDSSAIESVTVKAEYILGVPTSDDVTDSTVAEQIEIDDRERINATTVAFSVVPPEGGAQGTPPVGYVVNVTDSHGNTISVHVMLNGSETAEAIVVDASSESHDGGVSTAGFALGFSATVEIGGAGGVGTISATGVGAILLLTLVAIYGYVSVESKEVFATLAISGSEFTTATLEGGRFKHVPPTGGGLVAEFPPAVSDGTTLRLPRGAVYDAPPLSDGLPRRWGWEQIIQLPGIQDPADIGEVLRAPSIGHEGPYTVVIGDNPGGPGQIQLYLLGSTIVAASITVPGHNGREIEINEWVVNKILQRPDWDHSQIGDFGQAVLSTLIEIVTNPDEVWEDPNHRDRWMYVKRLHRNGREIIVTLFVVNGEVTTAFAPTFRNIPGPLGHTEEFVEYYIKKQEMVKRFEDQANKVVDDVTVGERAKREQKPDPP